MQKPTVIIRQASYDYATLKPLVFELADFYCGDRIRAGSRVVIKPNLLAPASPDKAIVTHPLVVKAVAEYALSRGARVQISDSQAMGSFRKVLAESGLAETLKGLAVEIREFRESVEVDVGEPFRKIELARDAVQADLLINLPKLKTHTQMRMTLGVKNLFGCVVGMRKPEWHLRTGVNRELFALLLVKIHDALKPCFTLIDGILAMEGQGPGRSGTPRELGIVAAGGNTFALDSFTCGMLGMDPLSVLTNKTAGDMGHLPGDVEVVGNVPVVKGFRTPDITPLVFGPAMLHGVMRRHLVQRPLPDEAACRLCGECWKYCPARAIKRTEQRITIDYDTCIRCYCCIEVCPHAALRAEEPLLGKAFRRLRR